MSATETRRPENLRRDRRLRDVFAHVHGFRLGRLTREPCRICGYDRRNKTACAWCGALVGGDPQ